MSDTQTQSEADALRDLVKSPGWLYFLRSVKAEWGTGYGQRMKEAIANAKAKGEDLHNAVEKVDYANDVVNTLMSWPDHRIAQLAVKTDTRPFFSLRRT